MTVRRQFERMRATVLAALHATVLLVLSPVFAVEPSVSPAWKLDAVHLKSGITFRGMLVKETESEIYFQNVRRQPGRATVVFFTKFLKNEVAQIDRISPEEREALAARLQALDRSGDGEKQRMEELVLNPAPWGGKPSRALSYTSDHFVLSSNAPEEIVRRAAVRLEQIYAAYTRFLSPRQASARPTTILLFSSFAEYQAMLKAQGRNILNPALFDPQRNQVLCASDLQRLGEDLAQTRKYYDQLRKELRAKEAELRKLYKGKVPPSLLQPIVDGERRLKLADDKNNRVFDVATRQLFRTLYHEAFHAYLAGYVYPPGDAEVPRWLNEGLAQIFETAIVEAGELRVGHADAERLVRVQAAVRKGEQVALADLLKSGAKQFVVAHGSDREVADRYYLAAWALAFHLMFESRLLGTEAMDRYVQSLRRGGDSLEAFRELIDQPLPQFDKEFRAYLLALRLDGTTAKAPGK